MALHPILAADHVVSEYRDYLRTEFRATDPALRSASEEDLNRLLARAPVSASEIAGSLCREEVPERKDTAEEDMQR